MSALHVRRLFVAAVFLASAVVLALQLVNPSPVMVSVGDNGTEVAELGGYFRYQDVWIITAAAVVLGASGSYLLFGPPPTGTADETSAADTEQPDHTAATANHDPAGQTPTPDPVSVRQPATTTGESPAVADGTGNATPSTPSVTTATDDDTTPSDELLEARKREWEATAERLANKEAEVYESLLDADGVLPQSDIVEETDLSKASVSRALDSLETKNLVERKRRGMGNMVLLC